MRHIPKMEYGNNKLIGKRTGTHTFPTIPNHTTNQSTAHCMRWLFRCRLWFFFCVVARFVLFSIFVRFNGCFVAISRMSIHVRSFTYSIFTRKYFLSFVLSLVFQLLVWCCFQLISLCLLCLRNPPPLPFQPVSFIPFSLVSFAANCLLGFLSRSTTDSLWCIEYQWESNLTLHKKTDEMKYVAVIILAIPFYTSCLRLSFSLFILSSVLVFPSNSLPSVSKFNLDLSVFCFSISSS